ncbi:MAG: MXAN_6577-like cysteine-rich protein [Pseudomonadota bacterium]
MKEKVKKSLFLVSLCLLFWHCSEGASPDCEMGKVKCGNECVNLQINSAHCGACDNACGVGSVCISGVCTVTDVCGEGLESCNGECVDLRYNPSHCGACNHACDTGQACSNGICTGGSCPPGQTDCPGTGCTSLRNDPENCGSCGVSCSGNPCYEGACQESCPAGQDLCSGRCVDLKKDEDNCGTCSNVCADGEVCNNGECEVQCPPGFTDCSGVCVNLPSDHGNCGSCGNICGAEEVCVSGDCSAEGCPEGQTDCAGGCKDTSTDESNCGSCGNLCDPGESCVDGECLITCPEGQELCEGRCVATSSDEANCGACGNDCRADQVCSSGDCVCPGSWEECGGACVDTQNNPDHCGSCTNTCEGSEACVEGDCTLDCPEGMDPCFGYCVDTGSDRRHCGECGNECETDESCVSGTCESSGVCLADSCSTAVDVSGGGRFTGNSTCAGDDYSGSCGGSAGREIVFKFTLTKTQDIFISTQGTSFDTVLYVRRAACDTGTDSWCNDDEHDTWQSELNLVDLAAGTYYVFLDGYFSSSHGDYVFDIYMTDPSFEGDRCGDPEFFDVYSVAELSGDTCPWYWFDSNPDTVGCRGLDDGKDRVYYFIIEGSSETVTFSLCGEADWDTVLYVRDACADEDAEVVCDDDGCDGLQSTITADLDPGLYYLWVDGWNGSACGGYTVNVSM